MRTPAHAANYINPPTITAMKGLALPARAGNCALCMPAQPGEMRAWAAIFAVHRISVGYRR
jgi:hypothetical protein